MSSLVCTGCGQAVADEDLEAGICGVCGRVLGSFHPKEGLPPRTASEKLHDTSPPSRSRPTIREIQWEIIRGLVGWSTLQTSLRLVFSGLLLLLAANLTTLVVLAVGLPLSGEEPSALLIIGPATGLVLGSFLILVGLIVLCAIPASSGAREWSVACSVLLLGLLGLELGHRILLNSHPTWFRAVLPAVEVLVGLLGVTCYLLALRGAARALGNHSLRRAFAVYLLCFLLCNVGAGVLQLSGALHPFPAESILLGWLVPQLLLLVWLLVLVELLRRSATQAIRRS